MVFLRLSVKVFPREQMATSSSSGWGRSLLGGRKSTTDDSSQGSAASTALKKPGVFLLVIKKPEEISLGGLAGMIIEQWAKLHPELESLAIKKILDDTKEDIDLHPELTVADVWVDHGKARADGLDQHGSVRVLQKPTSAAPERFPSVEQDWDAAIAAYEHKRATQTHKKATEREFPAIQEEDEESENERQQSQPRSLTRSRFQSQNSDSSQGNNKPPRSTQKSPVERRHRDVPLSSVEVHSPVTTRSPKSAGPTIAGTPPLRRESEELGESPSPAERRLSSVRSRSTPAPEAAAVSKQPNLVKSPILPANLNQPTQSTEEATPSSSGESDSESVQQLIVEQPSESRMTNGAEVPTISKSPEDKQAEPVVGSSDEESGEEINDENDQDQQVEEDIVQDHSDEDTDSDSSDSGSEADEEDGRVDETGTSRMDQSEPIGGANHEVIDVDADGDVQMEPEVVTKGFQVSGDWDLAKSQTNGAAPEAPSRKRKQSSAEPVSVKEARQGQSHPSTRQQPGSYSPKSTVEVVVSPQRLHQPNSKSPPVSTEPALPPIPLSPQRRRDRAPSFSSPGRRASIRDELSPNKSPQSGIGLGITRSPPSKQPVRQDFSQESVRTAELPSTQLSFGGALFPSSIDTAIDSSFTSVNKQTPAMERTKKSAIRGKDSPASERRSVSFVESLGPEIQSTPHDATIISKPTSGSAAKSTPRTPLSATPQNVTTNTRTTQQTPTPAVKSTRGTPSTGSKQTPKSASQNAPVYPPGFDIEKLRQEAEKEKEDKRIAKEAEKTQKEKEKLEASELQRKLAEVTDTHHSVILGDMIATHKKLSNSRLDMAKRRILRSRLDDLRKQEKECEQTLKAKRFNPPEPVKSSARPSLKGLLCSQREEMATKYTKPRVEAKPAPAPRNDVYEVPSSSESESDSDSDSDSGDIMPDGHSEKLRKPRPQLSA